MKNFNVIDLFAGVGGLSYGFKKEGFKILYANEYDEQIAFAYKSNHIDTKVSNLDIKSLDIVSEFENYSNKVDLVMGGPPCQGFSMKGQRKGLVDERNFYFLKFFEVIKIVKPKFILIENVPNIISSGNNYFHNEIKDLFGKYEYDFTFDILRAEKFGVPQIRKRAFYLGRKKEIKFSLPTTSNKKTVVSEAIDDLPTLKSGEGLEFTNYDKDINSEFQKDMRINSEGVWNHISTKHSPIALERLSYIKVYDTKFVLPKHHLTKSIHSGTWTRLKPDGFAKTITTRFDTPSSGQFTLPYQDRCITVREAARLQTFPDTFKFYGNKTNQMLQVGNAVPPYLSQAIAKKIKENF